MRRGGMGGASCRRRGVGGGRAQASTGREIGSSGLRMDQSSALCLPSWATRTRGQTSPVTIPLGTGMRIHVSPGRLPREAASTAARAGGCSIARAAELEPKESLQVRVPMLILAIAEYLEWKLYPRERRKQKQPVHTPGADDLIGRQAESFLPLPLPPKGFGNGRGHRIVARIS